MNSVGEEFKQKLPKLAANIALAIAFGVTGIFASLIPANVTGDFGFYSWVVLTIVGGVFLIRASFDVLTISDKTLGLVLERLGIRQKFSRRRMAKDLMYIIAIILATAAIFPLLETIGTMGTTLQSIASIAAVVTTFLFVYDIAHTLYEMVHEKANAITDRLAHENDTGIE